MFMYENGVPVDSMKVVVGMPTMPTPLIASIMYYVTFNPQWNAPDPSREGPDRHEDARRRHEVLQLRWAMR